MSQIYSEPAGKALLLLLIGVIGYIIGYLIYRNDGQKNELPATGGSLMQAARDWYDKMYQAAQDPNVSGQNFEKLHSDWNKKFRPDWRLAKTFNERGAIIIEIPALKTGEMTLSFSRPGTPVLDFDKLGTITSLLIVKRKTDFNLYAMTTVASTAYLKAKHGRIWNNTYQKKEKDFEGAVFFNKMDGTFVNGWRYQNGEATSQLYPSGVSYSGIGLVDKKYKTADELSTGRSSLMVVSLWEDPIYTGQDPIALKCNTYITTNVYADCPVGEGVTIFGLIHETISPYAVSHNLPSRLRLREELHHLKSGIRNLN